MTDKITEIIEKMNTHPYWHIKDYGFEEDLEDYLYKLLDKHSEIRKCYANNDRFEGEARFKLERALAMYYSPLNQALR